jgi:predicted Zn-dependent peptidase
MAELAVLGNGLRVVLVPCEAQSVAFGLFVASGSRHETDSTAGISHFIEHMLFKGTEKRTPVEITRAIEGRGGNFNAWTSEESTAYFTHMPFEYLDEAVDIISDMYLNAKIAADDFAREREVILEEIKMYADEPDAVAMENLQRALFPRHRLGAPIAGSAESLMPLKPRDMKEYIASHYRADNTIAVIAGRFDAAKALRAVERALSMLPSGEKGKTKKSQRERFYPPVSEISVSKDVQQAQIALGYRTFGIGDDRKYAASVFDAVMGRGMSSRLFQQVREKRGLSYDISSRMQFFSDAGIWSVTAGVDPSKVEKTLEVIDRELVKICDRKVGAAELKRTKEFLTGNFRISHERVQSKLFFYAQTMLSYGKIVSPEDQVEGIRAVSADDVQAVAAEIIDPARRSLSTVVSKGTGGARCSC